MTALLLETNGASAAPTCTIYFTGATNNAWATATNWSLTDGGGSAGRIPAATDYVCMSTAPTRATVSVTGSRVAAGVNLPDTPQIHPSLEVQTSGTLTVGSSANGADDSTVNNLIIDNSATLGGTAAVTATGSSSSVGAATLTGAGTLTLSPAVTTTLQGLTIQSSRRLINQGTATETGYVSLYTGGKIENAGSYTSTASGYYIDSDNNAANAVLNDAGATFTLNITPTTNTFRIIPAFTNNGSVVVTKGHLQLNKGGSGSGSYALSDGTSLDIAGGTFALNSNTLSGAGAFNVNGGTVTGSATIPNLGLGGGTLDGNGTITIPSGGTATISGGILNHGYRLLNNGTTTQNTGSIGLYGGSTIENAGSYISTAAYIDSDGNAANSVLNGTGATFSVTTASANGTFIIYAPLTDNGTVRVTKGHLQLASGGSGSGSYALSDGTSLDTAGGTFALNSNTLSGAGAFNVNGGTVTGSATIPNLGLGGGTLDGNGTITIPSGGTATISGGILNHGYRLLNNGTTTQNTGNTSLYGGSTIENAGSYISTAGYYIDSDNNAANAVLNDAGATFTLNITPTTNTFRIIPAFTNNGSVVVTKGHLQLNKGGSGSGSYALSDGTSLDIAGGTFALNSNTLSGAGAFNVNGGTVTGSATIPNLGLGGGTLDGNGTITIPSGGTATISGGILNHGYRLLNNGTTTQNAGSIGLYGGSTIENAGSYISTAGYDIDSDGNAANSVLNDAGATLTVAAGSGRTFTVVPALTNSGLIQINSGTADLRSLTNLNGAGMLTGGTYSTTATGTILQLNANVVTNNATLNVLAGGIRNGNANALTALRTNTGVLNLAVSASPNGPITNSGTIALAGGTLQPTAYTQTAGLTTLSSGAGLRGGSTGTGAIAINGGTLAGVGTVTGNVTGGGTFQPGGGAGALAVSGTFSPSAAGTVATTISGPSSPGTDFGQITVSAGAALPNNLAITTAAGYTPPVGTAYTILSASSRSGSFSTVTGQELPNGTYYDVSYSATAVTLTVTAEPAISAGSVSQAEGDTGTSTLNVPVTLSGATDRDVSVDYTTADGTANAGTDYAATNGTLTIPAGSTSASVPVTINGDITFEPDETFSVVLSNPVNATAGTSSAVETISNDDLAPASPSVTAISPNQIGQGAVSRILIVTGSNFNASSTVSFSGSGISIREQHVIDSTSISATVNTAATGATGPRDVVVTTPGNGSGTCAGCLTVNARPTITTVTPSALQPGAANVEVSVLGTGYQPGATAAIAGGVRVSASYVDPTELDALATVSKAAAVGSYNVTVINADGGRFTCTNCYSTIAGPTVTAISPSTAARGATVSVTISGTNFSPGAGVTGPANVTFDGITVINSTTITATMTVATNAKIASNQVVTVTNRSKYGAGWRPSPD